MSNYNIGDKYVMLKIWHDDLLVIDDGDTEQPWWNERIIRKATEKEIEQGFRDE